MNKVIKKQITKKNEKMEVYKEKRRKEKKLDKIK